MASQSLYRKWRSQTFGELVGQEPVIRTLKNALNSGNLAHAYLFTGPRGTGKTSTARLLAKTINCSRSQNGEPCNSCEQCREITAGNSFNVVEIDAASNRGIDSIRELREKVMMPPTTGKYKVYILDEAHMLTVEAFNALLKTLEEPPAHAIFVMATTDVHKMLPTVLSRCQRFDFKRITTRQIVEHLRFVAEQEEVTLEGGAAELIARAASGGMRDALSLLDQAIAYAGHTIALTQVQAMLGVADPRAIQKFISAVAELDSSAGLHLIHELAEAGADLRQINGQVGEYWRAMMLTKAGANIGEILDHTDDEIREIVHMSQSFELEELTECAKIFAQNELVQRNQGTPQLGLELALLSCIGLHRNGEHAEVAPRKRIAAPSNGSRKDIDSHHPPEGKVDTPNPHQLGGNAIGTRQAVPSGYLSGTSQAHPAGYDSGTRTEPEQRQPIVPKDVETEKEARELPGRDTVSYAEEDELQTRDADTRIEAPVYTASPSIPAAMPVAPEVAAPSGKDHAEKHDPAAATDIEEGIAPIELAITLQEVKEKWEYIKRRVKSKKDGAMIAALLNGYTVVGIDQDAGIPVVAIRANAAFHYTALQKPTHQETVEWAVKLELKQVCKVRMLPPGQSVPGLGVSIPPSSAKGNSTTSHATSLPQTMPPQQLGPREQGQVQSSVPTRGNTMPSQAQGSVPAAAVQKAQSEGGHTSSAAVAYDIPAQPSPLARTTDVRDNTSRVTTGDSRLIFAQKRAKNDQVVQEVARLFKAEIKNVELK